MAASSSNPQIQQAHLVRQLCEASKNGAIKKVKSALRRGADINGTGPMEKHSALMFATLDGRLELVKILLGRKADVNHRNKYGDTPLMWGCNSGYCDVVVELLNAKALVDLVNSHKVTALMEAANGGHRGIVKELMKRGAKLKTALEYARKSGRHGVTKLIEAEPKRRLQMGGKLLKAIKKGHVDKVVDKIKLGAPPNILGGEEKYSALMMAVLSGNLPIVKVLLDYGAKPNHQNVYGDSSLIWAASHGHLDIVRELLKHKADVTLKNQYKISALIEAANSGNADIVQTLLKGGAKIGDSKDGKTAKDYATKKGFGHIVRIFREEPKRLAHRERRIRFGVQLCRAMMYKNRTSLPISPVHMGIRKFFVRNPSEIRTKIGAKIASMHPALHDEYVFVPRPLRYLLSDLSPESDSYRFRNRSDA